ncbi:NERD domain-containing protein [Nocardioides mangrovicus]|uniref:NERD domain-containing protein n=1 Tax=Nocardioides mangrovicus TaxID=2478913 RepID=A0A3L8P5K4_9ACTN|nr:nuclease-related domain-containing protein [Nocardioides mangrovicus]RLV50053.1 NERD domain-containing protein [Nocardioides mangrovicus]
MALDYAPPTTPAPAPATLRRRRTEPATVQPAVPVEPAAAAPIHKRGPARLEPSADALDNLPAYTWRVMHDVPWPGREGQVIDHVVIGPGGIFVVDLRHWDGPVVLEDGILRAEGRPREREVAEAADAALDVASVLERVDPRWVVPVLCLVRDEPVAGMTRGVVYCSSNFLEQMITSRREVIGPDRSRFIAQLLEIKLARGRSADDDVTELLADPAPRRRRGRLLAEPMTKIGLRAGAIGVAIAVLVGDPSLIGDTGQWLTSLLTVR